MNEGNQRESPRESTTAIRTTVESALAELAEDAERYLSLYRAQRALTAPPDSDEAINLEAELEVQAHVLGLHGSDAHELIDQLDESLTNADNARDTQPSA